MTDPDDVSDTTPRPGPLRTTPIVTATLLGSAVAVGLPFTGAAPVWAAVTREIYRGESAVGRSWLAVAERGG